MKIYRFLFLVMLDVFTIDDQLIEKRLMTLVMVKIKSESVLTILLWMSLLIEDIENALLTKVILIDLFTIKWNVLNIFR